MLSLSLSLTKGMVEVAVPALALERIATFLASSTAAAPVTTAHPRRRLRHHPTGHRPRSHATATASCRPRTSTNAAATAVPAVVGATASSGVHCPACGVRIPAVFAVAIHAKAAGNRPAPTHGFLVWSLVVGVGYGRASSPLVCFRCVEGERCQRRVLCCCGHRRHETGIRYIFETPPEKREEAFIFSFPHFKHVTRFVPI